MENRNCNQEIRRHINTKQNTDTNRDRGDIGDRSSNLIKLIGAERVSRRNFKYEGTYYITEDGELYDKEHVIAQKVQRTGVSFYEVTDWEYDERKRLYQPTIRRIVMIKNTNTQLSLNL
nr:MAG TPA: hypothetical protein [Microviridae sp.]